MTRRELLAASLSAVAAPSLVFPSFKPTCRIVRTAKDQFDLILRKGPRLRIMQIADTHFGAPTPEARVKDKRTYALIHELIDTHRPDYLFHTGDFINNDKVYPEFGAIPFMSSLELPWSVVFGNHDHPRGGPGQKSLDRYYADLGTATIGYADRVGGCDYCFRVDLRLDRSKPFASIFAFNTGGGETPMKVNEYQLEWFNRHMAADVKAGVRTPIYVMQHIPTLEYRDVFAQKLAVGRQGEGVCFEEDHGEIFRQYVASGRVRAVFCGHDHVNDYVGKLERVALVYGRCTGYSGYGDWERGARLIDIDASTGTGFTHVVLGSKADEKPEWSYTLNSSRL